MGTRSYIGMVENDGKIRAVYCHWDGYPSHNGKILLNHYDENKTKELLDLGDLSSLGPNIGTKHEFDARPEGECTFYGRDRGEPDVSAKLFKTEEEFLKGGYVSYCYLLRNDGWYVSTEDDTMVKLTPEIIAEE